MNSHESISLAVPCEINAMLVVYARYHTHIPKGTSPAWWVYMCDYVFTNTKQSLFADFLEEQYLIRDLFYYIVDTVNVFLKIQSPGLISLTAFVNPFFVISVGNNVVTFG